MLLASSLKPATPEPMPVEVPWMAAPEEVYEVAMSKVLLMGVVVVVVVVVMVMVMVMVAVLTLLYDGYGG